MTKLQSFRSHGTIFLIVLIGRHHLPDGDGGQQEAQRFARRAAGEEGGDPTHQRWPRFQSSIRAWIATAMPISATAMNTQRRVSR